MAVAPASSAQVSFDKSLIKVVLLESVHRSAVEALQADGYTNIQQHPRALEGQALRDAIADAHFVGIRSRTQLTAEVLAAAPKLIAIGAFCIGTNQVDLQAAETLGVPVFNAPFSNTRSVAELVLAEIVMLLRGIPQKNAALHRGGWDKSPRGSLRSARQDARHRRLRPHRHAGRRAGRSAGHARRLLRHRDQARARQCAAGAIAGRAAGRGRRRDAARAGDAADAGPDRRATSLRR